MAYIGASAQFTVAGVTYTYNLNSSHGSAGIWTVQNVNPTYVQAKSGSALDNEVQPFAEIAYSDWTGSIGLHERTDDPGDFTRPFLSSCDTSKPRQLTGAPRTGAGTATIAAPGIDVAGTVFAWVDSTSGPGFVAKENGSAAYGYWRWNETTFVWDFQRAVYMNPPTMGGGGTNRAIAGSMHQPFTTVVQYGTHLYMPTVNGVAGLTDIAIAAAAPAGATAIGGCVLAMKYFDQLVTFSLVGNNIVVVALAGDPLTITQSIAADGTKFNNTATIYGETNLMGCVACNGALFLFTDRSLYVLQWVESTNVFVIEPIIVGNAKFTSNPVVFNNELYCGADNQLWHWTPGQQNPDYKQVDATGFLPAPYNGRITELHPFMQTLVVKVVDNAGASTPSALNVVFLRYTALGAWQYAGSHANNGVVTVSAVTTPALKTQDGTNVSSLHTMLTTTSAASFSIFESGQNIRTVAAASAYAAQGIHVTPWEYGENRTAQKQYLRDRWEVENTNIGGIPGITAYYQINKQDRDANSPSWASFPGGASLGGWVAASPALGSAVAGDAGSALDSTGTGVLWTEHDGSNGADWHGATAYPSFQRIRFLYWFDANAIGIAPPALLSHAWQRLEYAFKFYVINTVLKLEVSQDHPNNPGQLQTPADLTNALNQIQSWDYGKAIITVLGPDNVSYPCIITKYLANITDIDADGPKKAAVALTLQSVKLFGLAV